MRRYFTKLFGAQAPARRSAPRALAGARLQLNALEDRLTPADLVATQATLAVPVVRAGEAVAVQFSVRNTGTPTSSSAAWGDRLLLSNDAVVSPDDTVLGGVSRGGILATGASYAESLTGIIPHSTPAGTRYLIAVA